MAGRWSKRLIRTAHERGIAVIADVAYNHMGPSDLDLWQFDGWSDNGKGGIYFYNDRRCQTPWGDTRPDYGRPEVVPFLRDNARMWLEEYRLDGLRWDATVTFVTSTAATTSHVTFRTAGVSSTRSRPIRMRDSRGKFTLQRTCRTLIRSLGRRLRVVPGSTASGTPHSCIRSARCSRGYGRRPEHGHSAGGGGARR